jgi:cell division protein FtsN
VPLQGAPTSALAPVAAGTGPIVQTALAKPVRGVEPTATKASRYWVQVGAFKDAAAASRVAERLLVDHLPVGIAPGASLTRVRVGPFADRVEAVSNLRTLELKGYRAFIAEDR